MQILTEYGLLVAMQSHFLKSTFLNFRLLVVLNMILRLNITLYSDKKY